LCNMHNYGVQLSSLVETKMDKLKVLTSLDVQFEHGITIKNVVNEEKYLLEHKHK